MSARHLDLPEHISQAIWRGDAMGGAPAPTWPSAHPALDAVLPGGGWPVQSITEILQPQPALAEWRLLAPGLARLVAQGGTVLLIGPPQCPHLPGLLREGLREDRLIWINATSAAERLWSTEQALKARSLSAVLTWLPQAQPAQVRRLQACALQHPGLAFVFRPEAARAQASAAPLRILLSLQRQAMSIMQVRILKRRGSVVDQTIECPHWPNGVETLIQRVAPSSLPPQPPAHLVRSHVVLDGPAARPKTAAPRQPA